MKEQTIEYRLEVLVLALVAKKISMQWLIASGFTPGQIMRALLDTQEAGYVATVGGKTELSILGFEKLSKIKMIAPKEGWILPLLEERTTAIEVTDIWLPDDCDILD